MEEESFEDLEIAETLNDNFVCIKVDREERPDIDSVYMTAVHMLTGRGGWPMTVIMTPDRLPILAGTYFPPRDGDRGASTGFLSILRELAGAWANAPGKIQERTRMVRNRIRATSTIGEHGPVPAPDALHRAASHLAATFDPLWGGFGDPPKFPRSVTMELLGRYYRRTKDDNALHMMVRTLEKMSEGGIYDHVGGGFHRYSVDEKWLVPHFEKMLYDNAQLVVAFLEVHQLTGIADFARIATETLDYLQRDMLHERGGFFSATDADSPTPNGGPEEGRYFTWTKAEIRSVLGGSAAECLCAHFGVTDEGNFEGRNVLHTRHSFECPPNSSEDALPDGTTLFIRGARVALLETRNKRPRPILDNKVLASWNGLAISAFARGGFVLERPEYVTVAERAAEFVLEELVVNGELKRSWRDGISGPPAYLDDYAFFVQALLDLYEATGTQRWLSTAIDFQKVLDERFADLEHGGYYFTAHDHEELLFREKPFYDGAEPSGNSVAALNLLRLEQFTERKSYRRSAERVFSAAGRWLTEGIALPKMLCALDYYLDSPLQIVVSTGPDGEQNRALLTPLRRTFTPNKAQVILSGDPLALDRHLVPFALDKRLVDGCATAYVCKRQTCEAPINRPTILQEMLEMVEGLGSHPEQERTDPLNTFT
jgi:hypothetical protein